MESHGLAHLYIRWPMPDFCRTAELLASVRTRAARNPERGLEMDQIGCGQWISDLPLLAAKCGLSGIPTSRLEHLPVLNGPALGPLADKTIDRASHP
jgi:hypothetical protein